MCHVQNWHLTYLTASMNNQLSAGLMNGKLTSGYWVLGLLLRFFHGVWWPGRTLATPEVAASGAIPSTRSKPRPPVPLRQCQSTSYEQAKNHRLDISTGSQKGSFMGHYSAERQAVCKSITTGAQGVVWFWGGGSVSCQLLTGGST